VDTDNVDTDNPLRNVTDATYKSEWKGEGREINFP
jgi:hypothetical protein